MKAAFLRLGVNLVGLYPAGDIPITSNCSFKNVQNEKKEFLSLSSGV